MDIATDKQFFEGKDFNNSPFKALIPIYYPWEYQKYINQETQLLKKKLKWTGKILEAGVGIGRLIPELAPIVKEFVGIDNAARMLKESKKSAKEFLNVKIIQGNLEDLDKLFPKKYFDVSLCLWNTLGNIDNEVIVLKNLWKITKESIYITTYLKGTIKQRKIWYTTVGIEIDSIDTEHEIFYSKSGLKSKSYSREDIEKLAREAKLEIIDIKILNSLMIRVELKFLE